MNHTKTTLMGRAALMMSMLMVCLAVGLISGCKEKGPAEKAGADVDKAVGDVKEAAEEAGDDVKDAVDDATKKD